MAFLNLISLLKLQVDLKGFFFGIQKNGLSYFFSIFLTDLI